MLFDVETVFGILNGLLQASALCVSPTGSQIVISPQIDADELSLCDIADGSVHINYTGTVSLDGLRNITGSLSAKEGTSPITSNSLLSIGEVLAFKQLAGLETLCFPSLLSVGRLSISPQIFEHSLGLQNASGIMDDGHCK